MSMQRNGVFAALVVVSWIAAAAEFHLDPRGNDGWSGRRPLAEAGRDDGPFATPVRAREAARTALRAGEPVTIIVHDGTYELAGPLVLGPEDSGRPGRPSLWTAAPGARPVFSGGRAIAGWRSGEGGRWVADVPDVRAGRWYFHQLFVDGRRAVRARHPNEGWMRTDGPLAAYPHDREKTRGRKDIREGFRFRAGDLSAAWANPDDINVFLYHSWTASLHWLNSVDEAARTVRFSNPCGWPVGWWEREQRYHVENLREALDAPGEWYLDRRSGRLEYVPRAGEAMDRVPVIAPAIQHLLIVAGDWATGRFASDIAIRGLSFQHSDWSFSNRTEAVDGQAAVGLPGAIELRGAHRIEFENCEIAHVGSYAMDIGAGCRSNRVHRCRLWDMGAGGIKIGEFVRQSTPAKTSAAAGFATPSLTEDGSGPRDTGHTIVDNCLIHEGGRVFPAGVGVIIGHSAWNRITRNEICDLFYSAVSVGWVWGFGRSAAHHNMIQGNHLHHIGWGVLSDMGGVYTLGPSPGTVVSGNHIHHVNAYSYGGWGLYTDEGSSDIVMENNIVHDTKTGGFHQHYGRNNVIRNNILAFSREAQVQRSREDLDNSVRLVRNLIYCDNDTILIRAWRNGDYTVNSNIYWSTVSSSPLFDGRDWEEWRATSGQDSDSLLVDPRFVDPERRDFRLRPDSPAASVGFRPIDTGAIGLYGDPAWVALARSLERPAFILPPTAERSDRPIADGFETTEAGRPPAKAQTIGEVGDATVRVVEGVASSGRRSLRFVDAPGLAASSHPMISYPLQFRSGTGRASFDLRMDEGGVLWHEWRDAAKPYNAGPSIRITGDGDVIAGGRKLARLPRDVWVRIEIECPLGAASTGTFSLRLQPSGDPIQTYTNLPLATREFRKWQWAGFISAGTNAAVFHIDNLRLAAAPP